MAKKRKHRGHYCKICGDYKPNEKFSGKGHAKHICKECASLPQEKKNKLQYINHIDRIAEKYPRSRQDWEFLEKYAKNKKYPEVMEYAQMILDMSRNHTSMNDDESEDEDDMVDLFEEKMFFSEFDEYAQGDIESAIEEDIRDFIFSANEYPKEKDKQKILKYICKNMAFGHGQTVVLNNELNDLYDSILMEVINDLEQEYL